MAQQRLTHLFAPSATLHRQQHHYGDNDDNPDGETNLDTARLQPQQQQPQREQPTHVSSEAPAPVDPDRTAEDAALDAELTELSDRHSRALSRWREHMGAVLDSEEEMATYERRMTELRLQVARRAEPAPVGKVSNAGDGGSSGGSKWRTRTKNGKGKPPESPKSPVNQRSKATGSGQKC
ncbi:hypothetical protein Ct61P_15128 [Colletotrichum tofieldiae]|nr:hypothetical protein Ct61P_15128 [Colletotrichum tofieldiae]